MFEELMSPALQPFVVAGMVVIGIAIIEVIALVLGVGLSDFLDSLLPDLDFDADTSATALSWLGFGQAPFMVVLIVILAAFSVAGLAIQWVAAQLVGTHLWPAVAAAGAFAISLPVSAWLARGLARVIPSTESSGIHRDVLVGRTGVISQGVATAERTAEAQVVGPKGLKHWIRVRAEQGEEIQPGETVRIIDRESKVVFIARRCDFDEQTFVDGLSTRR